MKAAQGVVVGPQHRNVEPRSQQPDQVVTMAQVVAVVQCSDQRLQRAGGVGILNQETARGGLHNDALHQLRHGAVIEVVGDAGDGHDIDASPGLEPQIRERGLDELSARSCMLAARDRKRRPVLVDAHVAIGGEKVQDRGAPTTQVEYGLVRAGRDRLGQQPVTFGRPLAGDRKLRRLDERPDPEQSTAQTWHRLAILPAAILTS